MVISVPKENASKTTNVGLYVNLSIVINSLRWHHIIYNMIFINLFTKLMNDSEKHDWMFWCDVCKGTCVCCIVMSFVGYYAMLIACVFYYSSWTSNLVDPASSHTLVSKIKPCMSKYKQFILWNCEWLIISVIVYLIVFYYLDNRSNSRANTCVNSQLLARTGYIY